MKKWMILAVCLGLVGLLAVNGTFAAVFDGIYQTVSSLLGNGAPEASDDFKVENGFMMRNQQRTALVPVDDSQMIMPAVYASDFNWQASPVRLGNDTFRLWPDEKVSGEFDRFISVHNVGDSNAYFRIAIAYPATEEAEKCLFFHLDQVEGYSWSRWADISVNGRPYHMIVGTYLNTLAPGESAPVIPVQLALASDTTSLDAIAMGGKLDLQVKTMAIGADVFVHDDAEKTPMTALEALDLAVPLPLDISQFNPFK